MIYKTDYIINLYINIKKKEIFIKRRSTFYTLKISEKKLNTFIYIYEK